MFERTSFWFTVEWLKSRNKINGFFLVGDDVMAFSEHSIDAVVSIHIHLNVVHRKKKKHFFCGSHSHANSIETTSILSAMIEKDEMRKMKSETKRIKPFIFVSLAILFWSQKTIQTINFLALFNSFSLTFVFFFTTKQITEQKVILLIKKKVTTITWARIIACVPTTNYLRAQDLCECFFI